MNEQRAHPRYAIELDAELVLEGGAVVSGRTRDLSKGGFCVYTEEPVAVSTSCRARLALVFSENSFSEQLDLPATVVWSTPVAGRHQLGIKLGQIDAQMRGYLDMFIKFLEDGEEDGEEDAEEDAEGDEHSDVDIGGEP